MATDRYTDILAMPPAGNKGPTNVTRIAADAGGGLRASLKGLPYGTINITQPVIAPIPPGNPLHWFDAQDIDLLGNNPNVRPVVVTATDNVTAASHIWVLANGNFTQADVGRILSFKESVGSNNGTFTIVTVTNATTIVTNGTQTNETFSTPGNMLASIIGPGAGLSDGSLVSTWMNKGAFLTGGPALPVNAFRTVGNTIFRKRWAEGRAGNLSSVYADGTASMATAAHAALSTPTVIAVICSFDPLAPSGGSYCVADGIGAGRNGFFISTSNGAINMLGGGSFATTLAVASNQINCMVGVFNGASSFVNLNGIITSANGNPSTNAQTGVTLFSFVGAAGAFMIGDIFEYLLWTPTSAFAATDAASIAQIQAYAAAKYSPLPH